MEKLLFSDKNLQDLECTGTFSANYIGNFNQELKI